MIFDKIRLIGHQTIDLPIIGVSYNDPFIVKSVDGLGPPDINIVMGKTLYLGDVYQGSFPQSREIVLYIRLNPNYSLGETPEALRERLYSLFFTANGFIYIQIMDGDVIKAVTTGYGKKFEAVPFSKDAEVQITFQSPQPFFSHPAQINVDVSTLSESNPMIVNPGTVEVGFKLDLTITADILTANSYFSMSNDAGNNIIIRSYQFNVNDVLTIDTRSGSRTIQVKRGTVITNLLPWMEQLDWLKISPGNCYFQLFTYPPEIPTTFNYNSWFFTPLYLGV